MEIRPAGRDEAAALHALVLRAYGAYPRWIGVRPAPMDADYAAIVARGEAFVAEDAGALVGLIVLVAHPDYLDVGNVAVDPDRQHAGVGRALLTHAEHVARARGLTELRLFTHVRMVRNIALYTRFGYHETERRSDRGFDRVFFAKQIPLA